MTRRLLFVINSEFPHYSGGRETWLANILQKLAERGLPADVVALAHHGIRSSSPQPVPASTRVFVASNPLARPLGAALLRRPFGAITLLWQMYSIRDTVGRWLRSSDVPADIITLDTVLTPWAVRPYRGGARIYCASKGPHAELLSLRFPFLRRLLFGLEVRAYRESVAVWANGEDTHAYIKRQGFDSLVIGNGVDFLGASASWPRPLSYPPTGTAWIVASVGSLLPIKGIANAINALARIPANVKGREVHLHFIGKGNPAPFVALSRKLGVAHRVHFQGEHSNVFPFTTQADLLLCLSGGGGLSMALLESLAAGKPVVAWDTPVYTQIITAGLNGELVSPGDDAALSQTIHRLLESSPAIGQRLGANGRASAASHSWDAVTDRLLDALGRSGSDRLG